MNRVKPCILTLLALKLHLKFLIHLLNKGDSKLIANNNIKIKGKRK